jgi:hypothetical protein
MRFLILAAALCLPACAKEDSAAVALPTGSYGSGGRDALCIAGKAGAQRAGFVVYGGGDANCSASGRIEQVGSQWSLIPAGDLDCKIPLRVEGGRASLGQATAKCAYYCGPGAAFDGKTFGPAKPDQPVTDFGGDALC